MKAFHCPYCGQAAFATLCTDCQAEGIRIQRVQSVFHIGRCHRCGHVDDEPCSARIGPGKIFARAWQRASTALKEFGNQALKHTVRVAESVGIGSVRAR